MASRKKTNSWSRPTSWILAASLIFLLYTLTAHAATFTVNSNADANEGTCDVANCTLRKAVIAAEAAAGADTIRLTAGLCWHPCAFPEALLCSKSAIEQQSGQLGSTL